MTQEVQQGNNEARKKLMSRTALKGVFWVAIVSAVSTFIITWESISEIFVTLQYALIAGALSTMVSAGGISITQGLKRDVKNYPDLKQSIFLGFGISLLVHIYFFNWFFA